MSMIFRRCWCIIYILFIYVPVIYADYVVVKWIITLTMRDSFWGAFNMFLFNGIIIFLVVAHCKAAFTDPGFVPLPQNKVDFSDIHSGMKDHDDDDWQVCDKCETYTPPRAHHCKICNRCIRKMDRHSFGINNCIGEENQKYFVQFLFYLVLLSVYAIVLVTVSVSLDCPDCVTYEIHQMRAWNSSFLCLLSAVYIVVALVNLSEQIRSIMLGVTAIEQAQKRFSFRSHKSKYLLASEVFGSSHVALWFVPCYKGRVMRHLDINLREMMIHPGIIKNLMRAQQFPSCQLLLKKKFQVSEREKFGLIISVQSNVHCVNCTGTISLMNDFQCRDCGNGFETAEESCPPF